MGHGANCANLRRTLHTQALSVLASRINGSCKQDVAGRNGLAPDRFPVQCSQGMWIRSRGRSDLRPNVRRFNELFHFGRKLQLRRNLICSTSRCAWTSNRPAQSCGNTWPPGRLVSSCILLQASTASVSAVSASIVKRFMLPRSHRGCSRAVRNFRLAA